jgi:hypothetical protein
VTALLVPTGIGAAIGGYAGDALPVARAIAAVSDILITHPNVLNGAQLTWPIANALYVEGYGLDRFAAGDWGLLPVHGQRIGVVFDRGIEPELRQRHLQVIDAARATWGLAIADPILTDRPLGVSLNLAASGTSWGGLAQPDSLLRAAERAIQTQGATAIAVVARFPETDSTDDSLLDLAYRQGQGVDPIGGAEAVISHWVVRTFGVPCAHAPALTPGIQPVAVAPRAAAEELGYTFLPCVLANLSRAPRLVTAGDRAPAATLWGDAVQAVVVPASACGSPALLHWGDRATILTVADNTTVLDVRAADLGIPHLPVTSYLEAAGAIAALRAGLDPLALRPTQAPCTLIPAAPEPV